MSVKPAAAGANAAGAADDSGPNGQEIYVAAGQRHRGVPVEEIAAVTGLSVFIIESLL